MQWSSNPVLLGSLYEEEIRTQSHLEGHVKTAEGSLEKLDISKVILGNILAASLKEIL